MARPSDTHRTRLELLRDDYSRAGQHFNEDEVTRCAKTPGTADVTGSEVARLLRDEDGTQAERQAQTLARHTGR